MSLEAGFNDVVHLQSRDHDVEAPEEDEDGRWDCLEELGSTELSADGWVSSGQKDEDGAESFQAEDGHRESQAEEGELL